MQVSIIGSGSADRAPTMAASASSLGGGSGSSQGVGGSTGGLPTLVAAIQKEGGFTQQASLRKVILERRLPWKPTYLLHIKKPLFVHKGLLSKVGTVSLAIVSVNWRGIRID